MKNTDNDETHVLPPTLLEFPCDFSIKVMGKAGDELLNLTRQVLAEHADDFDPNALVIRHSKNAKFQGITATIHANNKQQVDAIYQALSNSELVLMAL